MVRCAVYLFRISRRWGGRRRGCSGRGLGPFLRGRSGDDSGRGSGSDRIHRSGGGGRGRRGGRNGDRLREELGVGRNRDAVVEFDNRVTGDSTSLVEVVSIFS